MMDANIMTIAEILSNIKTLCMCPKGTCSGVHPGRECKNWIAQQIIQAIRSTEQDRLQIQTDAQNEAALAVLDKLLDAINGSLADNETLIVWTNELCNAIETFESARA